ncbi:MAG: PucR family transcriptional regulator [Clostridiaceae bacterium]
MKDFTESLLETVRETGVYFDLVSQEGNILFKSLEDNDEKLIKFPVAFKYSVIYVILPKKYEILTSLLKYTLESKFKDMNTRKEEILYSILSGDIVSPDEVLCNFPFLKHGALLFLIKIRENKEEALAILNELYGEEDVFSTIYKGNIIILGKFEDETEDETANSIRDSLVTNLYSNCKISYCGRVFNEKEILNNYEKSKRAMYIGECFGIKEEIYSYNSLIFEDIILEVKDEKKKEILEYFTFGLNKFDGDMINTIDKFIKCDLNISETSKALYIHRNTLIYRLDKIYKETGYDLRKFKDASVFITAFLLWKGEKNKDNRL